MASKTASRDAVSGDSNCKPLYPSYSVEVVSHR